MIFTGDPYDLSAPAASSVVPMLSELASLSADLGANQVSYLLDRWFVSALWMPSFSPASLQLSMRLMTIVSLLQEWVEGTVAYHAAVHSELRSLEAIAAACDSMALLLLMQAVCTSCAQLQHCTSSLSHFRTKLEPKLYKLAQAAALSQLCRVAKMLYFRCAKYLELQPKSMNHDWRRSVVRRFFT